MFKFATKQRNHLSINYTDDDITGQWGCANFVHAQIKIYRSCAKTNKLASLEATLVQNSDPVTHSGKV